MLTWKTKEKVKGYLPHQKENVFFLLMSPQSNVDNKTRIRVSSEDHD